MNDASFLNGENEISETELIDSILNGGYEFGPKFGEGEESIIYNENQLEESDFQLGAFEEHAFLSDCQQTTNQNSANEKKKKNCVMGCLEFKNIYGFPKDEKSRNTWMSILGKENEIAKKKWRGLFLCDGHFSDSMLTKKGSKLLPWANPDIPFRERNRSNSVNSDMFYDKINSVNPRIAFGEITDASQDGSSVDMNGLDQNATFVQVNDVPQDSPAVEINGGGGYQAVEQEIAQEANAGITNVINGNQTILYVLEQEQIQQNNTVQQPIHQNNDIIYTIDQGQTIILGDCRIVSTQDTIVNGDTLETPEATIQELNGNNEVVTEKYQNGNDSTSQENEVSDEDLQEEFKKPKKILKRKEIKVKSIEEFIKAGYDVLPRELATMVEMELRNKDKSKFGFRYNKEMKIVALLIYLLSPATYNFLSSNITNFPSLSVLKKFTLTWPSGPGNMSFYFNIMQLKYFKATDKSRYCLLCIDELPLKSNLHYDKDRGEIVGLEDNGLERGEHVARIAFVIMVRGLRENWKFPLDYIFSHTSCPIAEVKRLIYAAVRGLIKIGFKPRAVVSNIAESFQNLSLALGITLEKTFFMVETQKIHFFYDTSQILKCIKNNFMKYNVIFNEESEACWSHIDKFYKIDSKNPYKIASKLTDSHIYPNTLQKSFIQNSSQVISYTVASGIYAFVTADLLPKAALDTAEFIAKLDKLYDTFNSSRKIDDKIKRPPFTGNENELQYLKDMEDFIDSINFIGPRRKNITKSIKCLDCWKINIKSLRRLSKSLRKDKIKTIFTRRINLEVLSIFFGTLRKQLGSSHYPNAFQFSSAFRKMFFKIAHTPSYQPISSDIICQRQFPDISWMIQSTQLSPCFSDIPGDYIHLDYAQETPLDEFSQYIYKKINESHSCSNKSNEQNIIKINGTVSNKKRKKCDDDDAVNTPHDFTDYIRRLDEAFNLSFKSVIRDKNFDAIIFETLSKVENRYRCCEKFETAKVLWIFIRVRVHFVLKLFNSMIRLPKNRTKVFSLIDI